MPDETETTTDELAKKRKGKRRGKAAAGADVPEALRVPPGKGARKAKQTSIPGTERNERIPAIEAAADEYADIRDTRMEWTKKEVKAREYLRGLMKEHKLTIYECDGEDLTVELLPAGEEKIKVKRREADEDGLDDEAG